MKIRFRIVESRGAEDRSCVFFLIKDTLRKKYGTHFLMVNPKNYREFSSKRGAALWLLSNYRRKKR